MGFVWDGTAFTHAKLRLRVAPVPKRDFGSTGASGMNCRDTFARLVDKYNANKELAA